MALYKITANEAKKISKRTGMDLCGMGDGITFYATNEHRNEVWCFDTKKERDEAVERSNAKNTK